MIVCGRNSCSIAEVAENPEILDAVDYLLPYPTNEAEEYMHREAQAEMSRTTRTFYIFWVSRRWGVLADFAHAF